MGIFSRNRLGSNEFQELQKQISILATSLEQLHGKFAIMRTNVNSLRGLVNRKFGNYDDGEEDLNSTDGLDDLRRLAKKDGGKDQIGKSPFA